ncbi:MAG: hypothetical protein PHO27_11925 [Sulfuricurvum sp.]|nr:hypothetical protein [Sulfuricurvum sp.]
MGKIDKEGILVKIKWIEKLVEKYELDLTGLTVFTEVATNDYFLAGMIPAFANAQMVYMYDKDLLFENKVEGSDNIRITSSRDKIAEADIITNTGFIRPVTALDVAKMKDTAIIALMMSQQQIRPSDIEIQACLNKGIELIETDEVNSGILNSMGFKFLKVLFDAGLTVWKDKYLLLSTGLWASYYVQALEINKIDFVRTSFGSLKDYDAIIVADHGNFLDDGLWIGQDNDQIRSVISIDRILKENPLIKIINISGQMDVKGLVEAGIDVYPEIETIAGHSVVRGDYLGYKVVFEMMVLSLKAAEQAARKRLTTSGTN